MSADHDTINLNTLLHRHPEIDLAYFDDSTIPATLHIFLDGLPGAKTPALKASLPHNPHVYHASPGFRTLIAPALPTYALSEWTTCQNEPIKLGTQLQPKGAPWVGTAGAPARWTDKAGVKHWGILSNWHVMSMGEYAAGHAQHQPDDTRPACAHLSEIAAVSPTGDNELDAALADSLINGKHSTAFELLGLGSLAEINTPARAGLNVTKVGRTTGQTNAVCKATNACVRVGYGDFTANFCGQDIYQHGSTPFSAAGDSGSLIVTAAQHSPVSLLFAGGGDLTIGNPIAKLVSKFNLFFHP